MKTRYLALLSILFLIVPNLQAKRVPGVTDDTVKVGMITDLSGPIAFYGREMLDGMNLYLDHVNEQGGVHGRKIILLHEDDGYQPPRSIAAFRKLHDRDKVFCFSGNFGSSTVMATLPLIKRADVPLVGAGNFNSRVYTPFQKNVFSIGPSYTVQSWMIVEYILANWKEATPPRIAVIYQDDDLGQDGLSGLHDAVETYGLDLVAEESYKRGAIDFSSQVLNIKKHDPTHVILWTIYRETAAILKKAVQIDLKATFIGGSPASDSKILELAGADAEGYLALAPVDLWSESPSERLEKYWTLTKRQVPRRKVTPVHSFGYSIAELLVESLERTGRDLTREKLIQALETINQFETTAINYSYGPGIRGGLNSRAIMTKASTEKGRFEAVSDWLSYNPNKELAKH